MRNRKYNVNVAQNIKLRSVNIKVNSNYRLNIEENGSLKNEIKELTDRVLAL